MAALPPALNPSRASNGSQFYVVLRPQPEFDKDYTVFGQVTGGLEFLDSISRRGRDTNDYPLETGHDSQHRDSLIRTEKSEKIAAGTLPKCGVIPYRNALFVPLLARPVKRSGQRHG